MIVLTAVTSVFGSLLIGSETALSEATGYDERKKITHVSHAEAAIEKMKHTKTFSYILPE